MLVLNKNILTIGGNRLEGGPLTPPEPPTPVLPANTVRVRTSDGNVPYKGRYTSYETASLVPGTSDVYDVYMNSTDFSSMFNSSTNVIEVLGANTSNVTNMYQMFADCNALQSVSLFDTSNVIEMESMFGWCSSLTTVPLFDTSKVANISKMFYNCKSVQSGALALYQQVSNQTTQPRFHSQTFKDCGSNTTTGAAELAQIPSDWK